MADPKQLYDHAPESSSRRVKKYRYKRFSVCLETENAVGQKRWARGSGAGLVNENNSNEYGISMSLSHGALKLRLSSYGLDPVVDNKRFFKFVFETYDIVRCDLKRVAVSNALALRVVRTTNDRFARVLKT